jgi:hypothetical protein
MIESLLVPHCWNSQLGEIRPFFDEAIVLA